MFWKRIENNGKMFDCKETPSFFAICNLNKINK